MIILSSGVQLFFRFLDFFPYIFCFFLIFAVSQLGNFQLLDQPQIPLKALNFSQRRCVVKPLNAEPKRNESIVPSAATIAAPLPGMLSFHDFVVVIDWIYKKLIDLFLFLW